MVYLSCLPEERHRSNQWRSLTPALSRSTLLASKPKYRRQAILVSQTCKTSKCQNKENIVLQLLKSCSHLSKTVNVIIWMYLSNWIWVFRDFHLFQWFPWCIIFLIFFRCVTCLKVVEVLVLCISSKIDNFEGPGEFLMLQNANFAQKDLLKKYWIWQIEIVWLFRKRGF